MGSSFAPFQDISAENPFFRRPMGPGRLDLMQGLARRRRPLPTQRVPMPQYDPSTMGPLASAFGSLFQPTFSTPPNPFTSF